MLRYKIYYHRPRLGLLTCTRENLSNNISGLFSNYVNTNCIEKLYNWHLTAWRVLNMTTLVHRHFIQIVSNSRCFFKNCIGLFAHFVCSTSKVVSEKPEISIIQIHRNYISTIVDHLYILIYRQRNRFLCCPFSIIILFL